MQVHTVSSHHVVLVTGINEKVGIGARIHTGFHERQGMLGHARVVVVVVDDEQVPLQLAGQLFEVTACVAFGIGLWRIHVALAVHHFVILPVDDRPAGHAHLVKVGIAQQQARGHVSAKAPAVHADAVTVHVGQRLQPFGRLGLVFGLLDTQVTERAVLEGQSPVGTATVVDGEQDVSPPLNR